MICINRVPSSGTGVSAIKLSAKLQKPSEREVCIQQEAQRFEKFPEL